MRVDRWQGFSKQETQDLHHALRIVVKYPGMTEAEQQRFTRLADEIWDRHCRHVEEEEPGWYRYGQHEPRA